MSVNILIRDFHRTIIDIYKQYDLTCLGGLDRSYMVNDRNIMQWYSETAEKNAAKYPEQFNYFKIFDDLIVCSEELLYFTAHLFLYRPYINNPLKESFLHNNETFYPNNQNLEAVLYGMFADVVSQKAYNYWDRIGDLIASFFPNCIKPHEIYFTKAVESIPKEYHENINYLWLENFKETDYIEINKKRKQVVHYSTSITDFKYLHSKYIINKSEMQSLQKERDGLADFYKKQIALTIIGFEKTLLFLNDIDSELFPDLV